ncbi:MAG: FeoA domain-containing protein [Verrucomicrobia bacterium]|nr:FeoA domain-containing protein [Verrucomicrobiota bacterium]
MSSVLSSLSSAGSLPGGVLAWVLGGLLLAAIFWPRRGLVARWRSARRLAVRTRQEDALKHILKSEVNGRSASVASVAGVLKVGEDRAAGVLAELERGGLLSFEGGAPRLRPAGRELAQHVVRAHRLWESFLADQTGLGEAEWHRRAERQEHLLTQAQTEALAAKLGHPLHDPHGDAIPAEGEGLAADRGRLLTDVEAGAHVDVVHVEDEPEAVYRKLRALGLQPGMSAEVRVKSPEGVRLQVADLGEVELNSMLANNVTVVVRPAGASARGTGGVPLAVLPEGASARVAGLAPGCRGAERRRLLDLGFVPGTEVVVELKSPNGDPTAYRVRGAVIALRREQAAHIRTTALERAVA